MLEIGDGFVLQLTRSTGPTPSVCCHVQRGDKNLPVYRDEIRGGDGRSDVLPVRREPGAVIAGRARGARSSAARTGAALTAAEQSPELPPLLLSLGLPDAPGSKG